MEQPQIVTSKWAYHIKFLAMHSVMLIYAVVIRGTSKPMQGNVIIL